MIAIAATPPWMRDALCHEYPAEWWFPQERGTSDRQAKAVCGECLVRKECLAFAVQGKERFGVWGGYNFNTFGQRQLRALASA